MYESVNLDVVVTLDLVPRASRAGGVDANGPDAAVTVGHEHDSDSDYVWDYVQVHDDDRDRVHGKWRRRLTSRGR
jgi:hypothetical protein